MSRFFLTYMNSATSALRNEKSEKLRKWVLNRFDCTLCTKDSLQSVVDDINIQSRTYDGVYSNKMKSLTAQKRAWIDGSYVIDLKFNNKHEDTYFSLKCTPVKGSIVGGQYNKELDL